jgi:hypothetical protein
MAHLSEARQPQARRPQHVHVAFPKANHYEGQALGLAIAPYEQAHVRAPYVHILAQEVPLFVCLALVVLVHALAKAQLPY